MSSKAFDNVVKLNSIVSVKDYGAKGDGVTDDAAAINAAISAVSAVGGGVVFVPEGVYGFKTTSLAPADNVTLRGAGRKSVLKFIENTNTGTSAGSGIAIIRQQTAASLVNFHVQHLAFDGSLGYPANSDVGPTQITVRQWGVYITNQTFDDVSVTDCHFNQLSGGSVALTSGSTGTPRFVRVERNTFFKGGYNQRPIYISGENGARIQRVIIRDNYTDTNGPRYHYDAADASYIASTDAIGIDSLDYFSIEQNTIVNGGGIGIRVEQCTHGSVANNVILSAAQNGISVYLSNKYVSIVGNTITNWGTIPQVYSVRLYSGVYYYPIESVASAPADPSVDARFAVWPYTLTNVNVATIAAYTSGQQLDSFRGYSAIAITHVTTLCTVVGNTIQGNLTQSGGKYIYACDQGITNVHPNNTGAQPNSTFCYVAGNIVSDTRLYDYYFPEYWNPSQSTGGPSGGKLALFAGADATKLIQATLPSSNYAHGLQIGTGIKFPATQAPQADANTLDDYEEGSFQATITVGGGSVTMGVDRIVQYTKVGRLVTLHGLVTLSAISSPTGEVAITTLPYAASGSQASASAIIAGNIGSIVNVIGRVDPSATKIVIVKNNAGTYQDISGDLTNTSSFRFSLSYTAAS
jgi:hypothetical protein